MIDLCLLNMERKRIIAIDFDGTIVADDYPQIGKLKDGVQAAMHAIAQNDANYIIINTCRRDEQLIEAVNFLFENGIPFDRVNDNAPWMIEQFGNTRKIYAHLYIDSSNIGGMPNWNDIPQIVNAIMPF